MTAQPEAHSPMDIDKEDARTAGVAAGLGCTVVVSIIGSIVGGILLDRWLDTSPWFTLAGVALGLVLAGYQLYELASLGKAGSEPKIVTRQIQRVTSKAPTRSKAPDEQ